MSDALAETFFHAKPAADIAERAALAPGARTYSRVPPRIFGPLDEALAGQRRWMESQGEVTAPEAAVYLLPEARIFGSMVFAKDGTLVKESLLNRGHENEFHGIRRRGVDGFQFMSPLPEENPIHVKKAVMLQQNWDTNYGHWLIEGLPRVAAVLGLPDIADAVFLVSSTSREMAHVFADSLAFFGIRHQQLMFIGDQVVNADQLYYPAPLTVQPWIKSPLVVEVLENLSRRVTESKDTSDFPKKIFISRPGSSRRPLRNQSTIRNFFVNRGYRNVLPAQMSFEEQVCAFSQATHVAGVLGAECANFAFSPRGIRFLGLAPNLMQDDFFWDLASLKGGAYTCLHGPAADPALGMNAPFDIDIELLAARFVEFEAG